MADPTPEAVEAMAKVLWLADNQGADPDWLKMAWADMGGSEASDERAHHEIHAAALLADPGPLLEALAAAGVLTRTFASLPPRQDDLHPRGRGGLHWAAMRYVSEWMPDDA